MSEQKLGAPLSGDHRGAAAPGAAAPAHRVAPTAEKSHNALRTPLFPVACLRFDDTCFAPGASFVLPGAAATIRLLHAMLDQREGCPISVFGHEDPTGDDDQNKALSGRRALAIAGVLAHRVDVWEKLHGDPMEGDTWGVPVLQSMLRVLPGKGSAAGKTREGPYFAGSYSADLSNETRAALSDFQGDEGLPETGNLDGATLTMLFRCYFEHLTRGDDGSPLILGADRFLGRLADPDLRVDAQGCSEFNPVLVFSQAEQALFDQQGHEIQRDAENAANRRVLVLVFPTGTDVTAAEWPCPRAADGAATCRGRFWSDAQARITPGKERRLFESSRDTMACRFYHRFVDRSPCERTLALAGLHVRILDNEGAPKKLAPYRLTVGDLSYEGLTGDDGSLVHAIPAGATSGVLTVDGFDRTLLITPALAAEDDAGSSMRLQNLAFGSGAAGAIDDKPSAVQRFLSAVSLPIATTLSQRAIAVLRERYGA